MSVLEPEIQNIKGLAMYENKKRVGGLGRMRILMPRPAVADSTVVASMGSPGWLGNRQFIVANPSRIQYYCSGVGRGRKGAWMRVQVRGFKFAGSSSRVPVRVRN